SPPPAPDVPAVDRAARGAASAYAGARRVAMSHRVLEPVARRVATVADELRESGYPASQAEVVQAVIEFRLPPAAEAARLVERWRALVNAVPPD
ncbi:MAG: hypothetical protein ACR2ML_01520, partial [Solirubrobacteraceae bacterium]